MSYGVLEKPDESVEIDAKIGESVIAPVEPYLISAQARVPEGARLAEQFLGQIVELEDGEVQCMLTSQSEDEYTATFSVTEFLPGCSLHIGMVFDSYGYSLNGGEYWVNVPRPSPTPDPAEVKRQLRALDDIFGDSGY